MTRWLTIRRILLPLALLVTQLPTAAWSRAVRATAPRGGRLDARLALAARRGNPIELERAANRLGVGGLRRILRRRKSPLVMVKAALGGAPLVDRSWYLIADVAARGRDADAGVAIKALIATRRIAEDLRRVPLQLHEESAATIRPAVSILIGLAAARQRPIQVRTAALLALAHTRAVVPLKDGGLLRFLADPEPAIRQAAVELFAGAVSLTSLAPLARLVAEDDSLAVARAAAATLCAALPPERKARQLFLATLRNVGAAARLHELVTGKAELDEKIDIARCLRAMRTPRARRALARLKRQRAVRAALRRLR